MSEFAALLEGTGAGDHQVALKLFEVVYDDLKQLAGRYLAYERPGQTLQPTALVHETYLRLLGAPSTQEDAASIPWKNRRHFFAAASRAMRHILIDSARRKHREKRGGDHVRLELELDQIASPEIAEELLALDEALTAFAAREPEIAELVTLRYYGGLTLKEAAAALDMPLRTASANWAYARACLLAELTGSKHAV